MSGKVFIVSPYRGNVERNVEYAKILCRRAIDEGLSPIAPHLFFTQLLDDSNAVERARGIAAGLVWLKASDVVWVGTHFGFTEGMTREIAAARDLHKVIVYLNELPPS